MQSLRGHLLIAAPSLRDPNFFQTVVLIVEHGEAGALGLVLNRPSNSTLKELWSKLAQGHCESDEHVHVGGPVSGPLMILHAEPHLADVDVFPGVCFTTDANKIKDLIATVEAPLRVFFGHAGWGEGQLENELAENSWLVMTAAPEHVFSNPDNLWRRVQGDMLTSAIATSLEIKEVPDDPSVN